VIVNKQKFPHVVKAFQINENIPQSEDKEYEVPDRYTTHVHCAEAGLAQLTEEEMKTFISGGPDEIMEIACRSINLRSADLLLDRFSAGFSD
jgi:hypothetical protein